MSAGVVASVWRASRSLSVSAVSPKQPHDDLREGELHGPQHRAVRRLPLPAGHGLVQTRGGLHARAVWRVSQCFNPNTFQSRLSEAPYRGEVLEGLKSWKKRDWSRTKSIFRSKLIDVKKFRHSRRHIVPQSNKNTDSQVNTGDSSQRYSVSLLSSWEESPDCPTVSQWLHHISEVGSLLD